MNFTPFLDTLDTQALNAATGAMIFLIVLSVAGGIVLLVMVGAYRDTNPWSSLQKTGGILFILAYVAIVFGAVNHVNDMNEHNANSTKNYEIAAENLKAKYELNAVHWDSPETKVKNAITTSPQTILVEDSTGQHIVFKYTADPETGEVFLRNMPIQGGAPPVEGITADSLLRK